MTQLKITLKNKKMNQKTLALGCGVSQFLVSEHVRKGIKTARVAQRYAKILNCDPLKLIDIKK